MTIGEQIRALRKKANQTQKDLSNATGLAVNTISRYESGERTPTIDVIAKIAAALSVSVPDLLSGVDSAVINFSEQADREYEKLKSPLNLRLYKEQLLIAFEKLNAFGKKTAMKRVEELTEIERYTRPDEEPPQK